MSGIRSRAKIQIINTGILAVLRRDWSRAHRAGHIAAGTAGDAVVGTVAGVAAGIAVAVAARVACAAVALHAAAREERPTDKQSRQLLNRLLQCQLLISFRNYRKMG